MPAIGIFSAQFGSVRRSILLTDLNWPSRRDDWQRSHEKLLIWYQKSRLSPYQRWANPVNVTPCAEDSAKVTLRYGGLFGKADSPVDCPMARSRAAHFVALAVGACLGLSPSSSCAINFEWAVDASGDWNVATNWSPVGIPNGTDDTVLFGDVITAPRTVFTDSSVTVGKITFESENSYAIAGGGLINLDSISGTAAINVLQDMATNAVHQFQVGVLLGTDTDVSVWQEHLLQFNNQLTLQDNTLQKIGAGTAGTGTLQINNNFAVPGGTVDVQRGILGGTGTVGGDVIVRSGAVLAPGQSIGSLTISQDYMPEAGSILQMDVGGLLPGGQHDRLQVDGTAQISQQAEVVVDFAASFDLQIGQAVTLVNANQQISGVYDFDERAAADGGVLVQSYSDFAMSVGDYDRGDMDTDFNFPGDPDDTQLFPVALLSPTSYEFEIQVGTNPEAIGDMDEDGDQDFDDIPVFRCRQAGGTLEQCQASNSNGDSASAGVHVAVPEPTSLAFWLVFTGFCALTRRDDHA